MQMCMCVIGAIFITVGQAGSDIENGQQLGLGGRSLIVCKLVTFSFAEAFAS